MITFMLGYVAGGLSSLCVLAALNAYLTVRRQALAPAPPAPAEDDELELLRRGLAQAEKDYRRDLANGSLFMAGTAKQRAAEVRARIAALERAS